MASKLVKTNIESYIFLLKCTLCLKLNHCGVMMMSYLLINVLNKGIHFFLLILSNSYYMILWFCLRLFLIKKKLWFIFLMSAKIIWFTSNYNQFSFSSTNQNIKSRDFFFTKNVYWSNNWMITLHKYIQWSIQPKYITAFLENNGRIFKCINYSFLNA